MFSVTEKAAEEIKKLLSEENIPNAVLRVRVVPGGCSGFSYEMGFDDETGDSDKLFENGGVKVAIDELSLPYLEGSVLDYKDGLNGTGFSINNPNAKGSCGCGQSFNA
ncbi:MAG: iron-sulfur cluster insertion protein ErpA [Candidatus Dadabacteria bacterium]|jgi:iron-sulfur cluster assembly protein|nr:iron-sulfur cluster insertion protein ErpA [Candidatus Dadabacteria bacterium]HSC34872.1 iron-sulfur cluster insertion protein ErpA [Thermodesulfobacteriota bacterium]